MKNRTFILFVSMVLFTSFAGTHSYAQLNCMSCDIPNATYVFNDGDLISNQAFNGDVIEINGTVYIDGSCTFTQCTIYLSEQARIELMPGATELFLHSNRFYDCCEDGYMWDGIYTTDYDNMIFARQNYFRHGENTIVEAFGAEVTLINNQFDRCYYGLTLRDWTGSPRIVFRGNMIQSTIPITSSPIPLGAKTWKGVRIINYQSTGGNLLTIGDDSYPGYMNYFSHIFQAVHALNSDVRIVNNYVSTSTNGLYFHNATGSFLTCKIGGGGANQLNTLIDVHEYGIYIQGRAELTIENNSIEGGSNYGMLINQLITPVTFPGNIRNNVLILGKHFNGIPNNFEGIYVVSLTGDINIRENTIRTKTHNGVDLAIGRAILVGWNLASNVINIESNIIQNTLEGIFVYHVNADYVYVLDNAIEFTTTARDYGSYGIYAYITDVYRQFRIEGNTLENYIVSIYGDHLHRCDIMYNTINITALPYHPNHQLVGIHMSNSHSNLIQNNHIEMSNGLNTTPGNVYDFIGIKVYELHNTTTIDHNVMLHTEFGLRLANDVYPSFITCNLFDHAYHGVRLVNTKHGVSNPPYLQIGAPGFPANNQWYNELDPQGRRISGTANPANPDPIVWYYKTGVPFEIDLPQWNVTPLGSFDTYPTTEIFDICSQKSSPQVLTLGGLTQQDFATLSASQIDTLLMIEFHHLDSLTNYSSSLTTLTVPTEVRAYETVRNGYLIMVNNPWILSGSVTPTVNKYAAIRNYLSNTNIHTLYVLDTLANGRHLAQLNTELGAFSPQNQVELNAVGYYTTLGNYLANQFTLNTIDSVALQNIATQNSYTGGYPVFKARNMLKLYIIDNPPQQPTQPSLKQMLITEETESSKARFNVYPNPATDVLFVEATGMSSHDRYFIEIYSLAGKLLVNSAIRNNTVNAVDVNHLKSGFYIYRIVDGNGLMKTGKLIVQ